jgi:hypothetical protein
LNIFSKENENRLQTDYIDIKNFFDFCFVEERCPKVMWLWTLRFIEKVIKGNFKFYIKFFWLFFIVNFNDVFL